MNIFYKTSIILAIGICIASIFQSHQLRSQISSLKATISELEGARAILSLEVQEHAREEGYKQCIIDSQMGKTRYIVTQNTNNHSLSLWKLEEVVKDQSLPKKQVDF
jgi:hypothetical protein